MHIPVVEAEANLAELVQRAEAGDEVILTRDGRPAVRLTPITSFGGVTIPARRAVMEAVRRSAATKAQPGPHAARSQDFLYGDDGLPT